MFCLLGRVLAISFGSNVPLPLESQVSPDSGLQVTSCGGSFAQAQQVSPDELDTSYKSASVSARLAKNSAPRQVSFTRSNP